MECVCRCEWCGGVGVSECVRVCEIGRVCGAQRTNTRVWQFLSGKNVPWGQAGVHTLAPFYLLCGPQPSPLLLETVFQPVKCGHCCPQGSAEG